MTILTGQQQAHVYLILKYPTSNIDDTSLFLKSQRDVGTSLVKTVFLLTRSECRLEYS